jgi:hypothetical protein
MVGGTARVPRRRSPMSEDASGSFQDPAEHGTAESDVEGDEAQVEPDADADAVGRVQGQDEGYAEEQGSEVRAREQDG